MNKKYVIRWRSKVNGRSGAGTKSFGREEAERLAAELNRDYPDIEHESADAETLPKPAAPHSELQPLDTQSDEETEEPSRALSRS